MLQKAVRKKVQDKSGVFTPSCITLFKNIFFAIDSTDWQVDTQDDQLQLHGTVMDIFQEGEAKIQPKNGNWKKFKAAKEIWSKAIASPLTLFKAKKKKAEYFHTLQTQVPNLLDVAKLVPTWAAYNLLLTEHFASYHTI